MRKFESITVRKKLTNNFLRYLHRLLHVGIMTNGSLCNQLELFYGMLVEDSS